MKVFSEVVLVLFTVIPHIFGQDCLSRDYGNGGTVCVCNADYCDTIVPVQPRQGNNFLKYTSNKEGLRFNLENGKFDKISNTSAKRIVVDHEPLQTILGFGGAFTDAACINMQSLDVKVRQKLLRSYFSKDGIEYNLGRVPMAATDFSTHPYSYHDEEDPTLSNFNLAPEDYNFRLPIIRQALNLTNYNLELFASTWIAPKWMKTNEEYFGLGSLKESMYQTWADYFVKFLDAYKDENVTFWGITTGNEPSLALIDSQIPSVGWKSTQMVFEDKEVEKYVDGIAVHFYTDSWVSPTKLDEIYVKYSNKFLLGTEACVANVTLGAWKNAEIYASSIIEDINHWLTGWMDWNMAINLAGGPTYIGNNIVDSPIVVNANAGEFYKQPMYYAVGHFSKFVPRGSVRINVTEPEADVPVTAFKRPDSGIVIVILNKKNEPFVTVIQDALKGEIYLELTNNSITTILYW